MQTVNEKGNQVAKRTFDFILTNSLWLVGAGLMLASSGIDGAYMARWMTDLPGIGGAALFGYVLNTTSDISGMVLTYWFGRLQQAPKNTKQRKLSWVLIGAELIAVGYSWLFSWRQLRIVLLPIEGADSEWVSWVAAGFIPLLLAFVGYTQALLAGRIEQPQAQAQPQAQPQAAQLVPQPQARPQPQKAQPQLRVGTVRTAVIPSNINDRRTALRELYTSVDGCTQAHAAEVLGCSTSTIRNDLAALALANHNNGSNGK